MIYAMNKLKSFCSFAISFGKALGNDARLKKDKANRIFSDPKKYMPFNTKASSIKAKGYFGVSPSIQHTPVLYQAGDFTTWLSFCHATCRRHVIGADSAEKVKNQVQKIRSQTAAQGRDPQAIKLFVGITVVTAEPMSSPKRNWLNTFAMPILKRTGTLFQLDWDEISPTLQKIKPHSVSADQ